MLDILTIPEPCLDKKDEVTGLDKISKKSTSKKNNT